MNFKCKFLFLGSNFKVNNSVSKIDYDESVATVLLSDPKSRSQIQNDFSNLEKSSKNINNISQSLDDYFDGIKSGKVNIKT